MSIVVVDVNSQAVADVHAILHCSEDTHDRQLVLAAFGAVAICQNVGLIDHLVPEVSSRTDCSCVQEARIQIRRDAPESSLSEHEPQLVPVVCNTSECRPRISQPELVELQKHAVFDPTLRCRVQHGKANPLHA